MKTFNQIFGASLPTSEDDRKEFLANNCNHVAKEVGYSKAFTSVEVEKKRYELEKVSIYLEDKEEEKKEFIFLTLTTPNVKAEDLNYEIQKYNRNRTAGRIVVVVVPRRFG